MRILLDENLPHRLRHSFQGHDVATALWMGWTGIQIGDLLDLAEAHNFELFVTADQGISFQQNLRRRKIALLVLVASGNDFDSREPLMPKAQEALKEVRPGEVLYVER